MPNPASKFCIENGFQHSIVTNEDGSQTGFCMVQINNKTIECEEWKYFRGECPVAEETATEKNTTEVKNEIIIPEKKEEKFLVYFPWTKGEKWEFVTGFHDENCLDFANFESEKAPVVAAADGEVVLSTHSYPNGFNTYSSVKTNNPEDMGNFVIIYHKPQTYTIYMHFQQELMPPVKPKDKVKAGQRIGYEGNTGWSHGKHLHFCVVDVTVFPTPGFITKPLDSWGFYELNGSNELILNNKYVSQNIQ
jgi:hypothetical protein